MPTGMQVFNVTPNHNKSDLQGFKSLINIKNNVEVNPSISKCSAKKCRWYKHLLTFTSSVNGRQFSVNNTGWTENPLT